MQKTNFAFQAWISDDCSVDSTPDIIAEYAKKYPNIIVPIARRKNIRTVKNFIDLADKIKSRYVAVCEGDDFWTDETKLQKQVDYLEAHAQCSLCFHPVRVFFEDGSKDDEIFPTPDFRFNRDILDLSDLLKYNFIQTNSVVYRWRFTKENILDVFPEDILPGDYFMHLLHAQKGAIGFIDRVMSVYRRHAGGIWWDSHADEKRLYLKYGIKQMNFYIAVENTIAPNKEEYHKTTCAWAVRFMDVYIENKEYDKASEIIKLCPDALYSKSLQEKIKFKIKLFGFIPLGKIEYAKNRTNKAWVKLFGIIPILKIKWQ
jgi:glycosyltransferase involved in cell wall biosynthesis